MSTKLGKANPRGREILIEVTPTGCWRVLNLCNRNGYPIVWVDKKRGSIKVIYWLLEKNGEDPPSRARITRHQCSHRWCVNPAHILFGTLSDNAHDMVKLGESLRGEKHPEAKLTKEDVIAIREKVYNGKRGVNLELAKKYKVSPALICSIKKYRSWKWVR